jgi:uncharacterized membrane protein (Fun14 family)
MKIRTSLKTGVGKLFLNSDEKDKHLYFSRLSTKMLRSLRVSRRSIVVTAGISTMTTLLTNKLSYCDDKTSPNPVKDYIKQGKDMLKKYGIDTPSEDKFDELAVMAHQYFNSAPAGQIGYGFVMGYTSGLFVKHISKIVAVGVGGVFILIQTLAYSGYVTVNVDKMGNDITSVLDVNKDGKIDADDAKMAFDKVFNWMNSLNISDHTILQLNTVLSYQLPAGGGFTAGLIMGLRG